MDNSQQLFTSIDSFKLINNENSRLFARLASVQQNTNETINDLQNHLSTYADKKVVKEKIQSASRAEELLKLARKLPSCSKKSKSIQQKQGIKKQKLQILFKQQRNISLKIVNCRKEISKNSVTLKTRKTIDKKTLKRKQQQVKTAEQQLSKAKQSFSYDLERFAPHLTNLSLLDQQNSIEKETQELKNKIHNKKTFLSQQQNSIIALAQQIQSINKESKNDAASFLSDNLQVTQIERQDYEGGPSVGFDHEGDPSVGFEVYNAQIHPFSLDEQNNIGSKQTTSTATATTSETVAVCNSINNLVQPVAFEIHDAQIHAFSLDEQNNIGSEQTTSTATAALETVAVCNSNDGLVQPQNTFTATHISSSQCSETALAANCLQSELFQNNNAQIVNIPSCDNSQLPASVLTDNNFNFDFGLFTPFTMEDNNVEEQPTKQQQLSTPNSSQSDFLNSPLLFPDSLVSANATSPVENNASANLFDIHQSQFSDNNTQFLMLTRQDAQWPLQQQQEQQQQEQQQQEQQQREQQLREEQQREQQLREEQQREQQLRDQQKREQQLREEQQREQQLREQEQQQREQQLREQEQQQRAQQQQQEQQQRAQQQQQREQQQQQQPKQNTNSLPITLDAQEAHSSYFHLQNASQIFSNNSTNNKNNANKSGLLLQKTFKSSKKEKLNPQFMRKSCYYNLTLAENNSTEQILNRVCLGCNEFLCKNAPSTLLNHLVKDDCIIFSELYHRQAISNPLLYCNSCSYRVLYTVDMLNHVFQKHSTTVTVDCNICGEKNVVLSNLKEHKRNHFFNETLKSDFFCVTCDYVANCEDIINHFSEHPHHKNLKNLTKHIFEKSLPKNKNPKLYSVALMYQKNLKK